ncbi:DUF2610 domain-containing protein [Lyticum sinuosum]|uniref:DUF2610 super family n=1 Tax=Lyticum sinuosum TaxID=1332059 RepID=A0AAE4VL64_9RICK|nr:DUF2610 domain-containing protein [Lyticum sinuosum]MDZ5761429.1 DUF2610 super family [Lyticum sinuosum]
MAADDRRVLNFKIPCFFGGQKSDIDIYIGRPKEENNPIYFQNKFIQDTKGGNIPNEVIESLSKLQNLSKIHNVSFQELCESAFAAITYDKDINDLNDETPPFDED